MGLDIDSIRLLCAFKQAGGCLRRVMMLGRQWCFIDRIVLAQVMEKNMGRTVKGCLTA